MSSRDGRTEAPTPKKRRDSRQKGQVARSSDLIAWTMVLALSYVLPMTARSVFNAARKIWARSLAAGDDVSIIPSLVGRALGDALLALLPLLATGAAVAVFANLAQVGFLLSFKPLKPQRSRISPLAGFKRIYGPRSLWEATKQVLKAAVVVAAVFPMLRSAPERYLAGGGLPLHESLPTARDDVLAALRFSAYAMIAISTADYFYQRYATTKDLRMTRQEVRDEFRNADGDPMLKARQRSVARQLSTNKMLADAAGAQVVVTNPTHIAVALSYNPETNPAPRVVAVGKGALAAKIRQVAAGAGVPIVEAKPLARALHRGCKVGDEIPIQLYDAVARVLAFIRRLSPLMLGPDPVELPAAFQAEVPDLRRRRRRR